MQLSMNFHGRESDLIRLFRMTFTATESAQEGVLIGDLVRRILTDTPVNDLFAIIADNEENLVGACLFTRLTYDSDSRKVFLLAPLAVTPLCQRKGVGQQLIRYSLDILRKNQVNIVLTYGNPLYYKKVGFEPISEKDIAAPFSLSTPQGWMGISLTSDPLSSLSGKCYCASAFDNQIFW